MMGTMDATLLAAVARLREGGALSEEQAAFFGRVSRSELVSVRLELQIALWAGVSLVAAGAGLLVRDRLADIGPLAIAAGLGLAAALCFWYVARRAPAFDRGPIPSPTLAFDYVLLLGVLLGGTWLAWVEAQFRLLGPNWPWHLLVVALAQIAAAYRWDSRAVLTLGLASFAAWRGVALTVPAAAEALGRAHDARLRWNALAVGVIFLAAGLLTKRRGLKAHFEPVFGNLGLALVLGTCFAGTLARGGATGPWGIALAVLAPLTGALAWRARRADYFGIAVVAAWLGLLRGAAELHLDEGYLFLAAALSGGALALVLWARRRMREER